MENLARTTAVIDIRELLHYLINAHACMDVCSSISTGCFTKRWPEFSFKNCESHKQKIDAAFLTPKESI